MLPTEAVFHLLKSESNAVALLNIWNIVVTDATFHLLMSLLKVVWLEKSPSMFFTDAVSQSAMLPYVKAKAVVGLVTHDAKAVAMLPSVMAVLAQTAVSVASVPALHVRVPDTVYPLLHVGVHELPLGRLGGHVPKAPFAGAVIVHGLALQVSVSYVQPSSQ